MRIIVTGAAGYIGSVLCPMLRGAGHDVREVDIKQGWDVRTLGDLWSCEPDAVIPLAAIVGAPACAKAGRVAVKTNVNAIGDMLDFLPTKTKVIFPATDSGYPTGNVDETSTMNPQSLYAKTKYDAECDVLEWGGVSLRLASVFGVSPSMRWDLIVNSFVRWAMKCLGSDEFMVLYEPNYRRNFVHISDVCGAFVHALHYYDDMKGEAYNVGNSACAMTKLELCERIKQQHIPDFQWCIADVRWGVEDPDRRDSIVSTNKLVATGWYPKVTMYDGIEELKRACR